jgi:hypothetical protein
MSKNIQGVKIGNVVNLSIDGKLHKKLCADPKEADELYRAIIKAKENPTEANIKALRILLNERTRKVIEAGLEADIDTGEVYLAGFNTPIPDTLLDVIKEYHDNGYPLDAIINFWKLLMINPDIRVRKSLFDFITVHDFVLTDKGFEKEWKYGEILTNEYQIMRAKTFLFRGIWLFTKPFTIRVKQMVNTLTNQLTKSLLNLSATSICISNPNGNAVLISMLYTKI